MKNKRIILFLIMVFIFVGRISASGRIEVSSWSELSAALQTDNDVIVLNDSSDFIPTSTISISSKTVSIIPKEGKTINIVRTSTYTEFFKIDNHSNVTIGSNDGTIILTRNSSLQGDSSTYISVKNSTLKLIKTDLNNNVTSATGGAINIDASEVNINNCNFENNSSEYGGALFMNASSTVNITNSNFTSNTSTGSGGAIYQLGTLVINNSNLKNNTAGTYGGAIMVKSDTTITGGEISGNTATANDGGGIRVDGKLTINNVLIKNNNAGGNGGGIDHTLGLLVNNNSTISNNNSSGTEGKDLNPDPNSPNNIDWKKDSSLKIQEIDTEVIKEFNYDNVWTQGSTTAGNFIIVSLYTDNNADTGLLIVDKNSLEVVNTITFPNDQITTNLGHVNDLAYDKNTGYVYVHTMHDNKVAKFKLDSTGHMTNVQLIDVGKVFWGMAYDSDNNHFIALDGDGISIYDSNFQKLSSFEAKTNLTGQGIGYYKGHIYYACYEAGYPTVYQTIYNSSERRSNLIYVYDMTGNLVKTLYTSGLKLNGELESVSFLDNGEMIMNFNFNESIGLVKSNFLNKIKEVELVKTPTKIKYNVGENLVLDGLEIKVTYNSEISEVISDFSNLTITGFDKEKVGKQSVTLNYKGQEVRFDVEVIGSSIINPKTGVGNYTLLLISLIMFGGFLYLFFGKKTKQL